MQLDSRAIGGAEAAQTTAPEPRPVGKCLRCHRALKDPKSVERGMGPVCWAKAAWDVADAAHPSGTCPEEIVCTRINGEPHVNIPQRLVHHSPTGFEWGYGGSGPADLALNVLALVTDEDTAFRLHQPFKWAFIACMPLEGGVIKRADVLAWLAAHGGRANA